MFARLIRMIRLPKRTISPIFIGRTLRAAIAVAGFVLITSIATSDASASCGDYLVVHGKRQMRAGYTNTATLDDHRRAAERPAKRTCNGAQCRNRSSIPAIPLPQGSSTGQSKQATACETADAIIACPFSGTTTDQTAHARSGFPSDLLRPPRVSMLTSLS